MKVYEAEHEDLVESIIDMIQKDCEKEIFTMRIIDHTEEGIKTLVVFKDESILDGFLKVGSIKGKLAIRMQGNFI